jgi:hypothetical protein
MTFAKKKGVLPNSNKIVNIETLKSNDNITIQADTGYYQLKYYKNRNDFQDMQVFSKFIRGAEKIIRMSDEYKAYKAYLINEIGLDHCAVMPGVTGEKATIELHHGPILTLYDYCSIILDSYLVNGEAISSIGLAKVVMQEHFDNHVQCVMLSKTAHQLFHSGKLFIHPSQAWGDLNAFLDKYGDGVSHEQAETINNYLSLAQQNKSTDNGLMQFGSVSNWNKRHSEMLDLEEDEE